MNVPSISLDKFPLGQPDEKESARKKTRVADKIEHSST